MQISSLLKLLRALTGESREPNAIVSRVASRLWHDSIEPGGYQSLLRTTERNSFKVQHDPFPGSLSEMLDRFGAVAVFLFDVEDRCINTRRRYQMQQMPIVASSKLSASGCAKLSLHSSSPMT